MISKSFVLLMLIHTPNVGHQEVYIGKIPNCLVASDVIKKKVKRDKIKINKRYTRTITRNKSKTFRIEKKK